MEICLDALSPRERGRVRGSRSDTVFLNEKADD
jgi:hypothetical protein